MANNVNLGNGRAVYAAINHVENNSFRFTNAGMIAALRSPSLRRIIDATNPFIATSEGGDRVVSYKEGTQNPRILLNFKPAQKLGNRTTRTAAGGSVGSNGAFNISTTPASTEILFDKFNEFEIAESLYISGIFKEPIAAKYLEELANPKMRVKALGNPAYARVRTELGIVGHEILSRIDGDMLSIVNPDLITAVVAGIGKNAATTDVGDGTTDAPQPEVEAFEADGVTPYVGFWDFIWDTARMNKFTGKPIVVGGRKLAHYMQKEGVVSLADSGFKLDSLLKLPIEWYYDEQIDTAFGEDKILMWDSGAACMQTWNDHSDYGLVRVGKHQNMYYGQMDIDIVQYAGMDLQASNSPSTHTLSLDFRVLEGLDSQDFPTSRIVPSMRYGVFKRPVGFFTSDTANVLNKVTGIFAAKLTTKVG